MLLKSRRGKASDLPPHTQTDMLRVMRALPLFICLALPGLASFAQTSSTAPAFDVASVKPVQHPVGPDYNNQLTYSPNGFTARNVTVKRLVAEAYGLQLSQVSGPGWIDQTEYDTE